MKHILDAIVRGALIGLVIGGSLGGAMWWAGCQLLDKHPPRVRTSEGAQVSPTVNPDPRIEWSEYPVGGLLLCAPQASKDARLRCFTLPPGSVLLIPEVATNTSPRIKRRKGA